MTHLKLNNEGVKAIQFLENLLRDDNFHNFLKEKFPNRYWKKENEIFPSDNLFPSQELGELESGIKNLRKFIAVENRPLIVFNQ
jgi:hypothetical protein